jgi:hypothetical protein
MKFSAIKAEGYEIHANCETCRMVTVIPFSILPDGEFKEVTAKLVCSKCGERPKVSAAKPHSNSMVAKGLGRK